MRSPWSNVRVGPADARADVDVNGYRIDTGPTVLTMPDIIDDTFAAVGETTSDRLDLMAVDPAYRAQFADDSSLAVYSDADQMATADRRIRRRQAGGGLPETARLADPVVPHRVRRIHRQKLRFPTVAGQSATGAAGGDRRIPQMGHHGQSPHQRPTAAASLHLPVAVRRSGAAAGVGGLRGDRLHGHHLRSVLPPRRHAGTARRAGRGRDRCRRAVRLRLDGHRTWNAPATGWSPCTPIRISASPATQSF